ncbi:MAG: alkaline ceramidase [Spirochaetae bacterium HGW-Spirochaetae-1]|jgi:neutral ceramidase|nr:MAG: alkaline ceramidase [Spirochaetae bacterium HGW-Spirochaetae-1]
MKQFFLPLYRKSLAAMVMAIIVFSACGYDSQATGDSTVKNTPRSTVTLNAADGQYMVGTGIFDITGPAAEVVMGGYAIEDQKTEGISTRLWSRAYIINDGTTSVVFVSADTWMIDLGVKLEVAKKIAADSELSQYYNEKNILISATHTHNSVSGASWYFLYNATQKGFLKDTMFATVEGIYESIKRAHNNIKPSYIYVNRGIIPNAGWSRDTLAYNNNPSEERALYDFNTDKEMILLKFVGTDGTERGMINWYAVHPDCIGPENKLISGDSKGLSSYLFEKDKGTNYLSGDTFIAAFAQSNSGDVTPNVPFTEFLGSAEEAAAELGWTLEEAEDFGFPFYQAYKEPRIENNPILNVIVERQYTMAKHLYNTATEKVTGPLAFRHEYVDFRSLYVTEAGRTTCAGGMGASYSAGSPADNPSPSPLYPLHITVNSPSWQDEYSTDVINGFVGTLIGVFWTESADPAYKECHYPKPVILPVGAMGINFDPEVDMIPQILPIQVLKIGSVAISALPFEITSMAGRRLKATALEKLQSAGVKYSVVSGLANAYASYMATWEEYQIQSYAAAGTWFGPNQLKACQQEIRKLADAIVSGSPVEPGPTPMDLSNSQWNFSSGVFFDDKELFTDWGDPVKEPNSTYKVGDTIAVTFWGGHPRSTLNYFIKQKKHAIYPFGIIEKYENGQWKQVYFDWDPQVEYHWKRDSVACNHCTVTWYTKGAAPGTYRIVQQGHQESGWTHIIRPYKNNTRSFTLQ